MPTPTIFSLQKFHRPLLPIGKAPRALVHGPDLGRGVVLLLRQTDEPRDPLHVRTHLHRETPSLYRVW